MSRIKEKDINKNTMKIKQFANELSARNFDLYFVTLTYKEKKYLQKSRRFAYYKLPKQKVVINKHMKAFKDRIIKSYRRQGIVVKCYFIYANHKPKNANLYFRPHLHGIIAISRKKRIKDDVDDFWKKGFVYVEKIYDLDGCIDYFEYNIRRSLDSYIKGYQIYSRTLNMD